MRLNRKGLGLAVVAACASLAPAAFAATYTGLGTDNLWTNANNWSPSQPATGEDLIIADTTTQNSLSLNDGAHTIGLLQYGAGGTRGTPAFTITSGGVAASGLTINGGVTANGAFVTSTATFLINAPVTVQGDQTWSVGGVRGDPSNDAGVSITTFANGTAVPLTLNGKITKTGTGQLLFVGRSIGDGSIDVNTGTLKLNGGNGTPLTVGGAGTITVNNGASLFISRNSGTLNITKSIVVNAGGTISVGGNQSVVAAVASPINWAGNATLSQNSSTANQVMNFTGSFSGTGNITVNTSTAGGRFTALSGDNSAFSGSILNRGTLGVGGNTNPLGIGVYRADSNVASLIAIDTTPRTIPNVIDIANSTTFGSATTGDLTFTATLPNPSGSLTGIAFGTQPKTVTISNNRTTFSGTVNDTGGGNAITKAGTGTLVFSGQNIYTRPTVVSAGTLQVVSGGRIGSPSGTNTVSVLDAGLLQLDVAGIADGANLDVTSADATPEVTLASGVTDLINGLILNGVPMQPGTYGSTASGATNTGLPNPDDFFSGPGVLNVQNLAVVPEPGTLGLAGIALGGMLVGRRRRR
jgi:autotransporter-associated beta strand protein